MHPPRDYQVPIIADAVAELALSRRATVIMACGTGKTYTGQVSVYQVLDAAGVNAPLILHLSPSLGLLEQSYLAWKEQDASFEAMAICSDSSVGKSGRDDQGVSLDDVRDVGLPVTTNPAELTAWAAKHQDQRRIVFSTYQSSNVVAVAGLSWDAALMDEAHRTATPDKNGLFSTVLDDAKIKIAKRLFMTATPRIGAGEKVASMDNEDLYGQRAHILTFAEAIEKGLLLDYEVAVIAVSSQRVKAAMVANEGMPVAAAQIAATRAITDYGVTRMLAFFNSIENSKEFVRTFGAVTAKISTAKPATIRVQHLDANTPIADRAIVLDELRDDTISEALLVSNVKVLSEGIDVPALGAVMFADPRSSEIEIAQAVGRAMRKKHADDTTKALIILPVILEDGETEFDGHGGKKYDHLYRTIRALAANDEVLAGQLANARGTLGEKDGETPARVKVPPKITITGDIDEGLADSISLRVIRETTAKWDEMYSALAAHHAKGNDANVPSGFISQGGSTLGAWLGMQRQRRKDGVLASERESKLNVLGIWWDAPDRWNEYFVKLAELHAAGRDANVPLRFETRGGRKLGSWLIDQRRSKRAGRLSIERIAKLESIGVWWEDPAWETALAQLTAHRDLGHDANVSLSFVSPDGAKLGQWLAVQRREKKKGKISADRVARLEALGIWWSENEAWDNNFDLLVDTLATGASVPPKFVTQHGIKLGSWMARQREANKNGTLIPERVAKLRALGVLDSLKERWEVNYSLLSMLYGSGCISNVSYGYIAPDGTRLGKWLATQRRAHKNSRLSPERKAKLLEIGVLL